MTAALRIGQWDAATPVIPQEPFREWRMFKIGRIDHIVLRVADYSSCGPEAA